MSNPFISDTYQDVWKKHFIDNKIVTSFNCITQLKFFKNNWFPLFINFGRNMTNGITYQLANDVDVLKNKVLLIYDVPSYHQIKIDDPRIRLKKIKQYKGYSLDIEAYEDIDFFLKQKFNSKSRGKFRNYFNKLEKNHSVSYNVYDERVSYETYLDIMLQFKLLLENRFDDLGLENDILMKWSFYHDLTYQMLKEKRAILNTICIDDKIGAISLAFISESSIIGAVKAFDINYKSYSLGVLELLKLLEWSIKSNYKVFDFSKGNQAYKKRFIDQSYLFDVHIVYDSKSIRAKLIAYTLSNYFKFKQFLREKNLNTWYWKLRHKLA